MEKFLERLSEAWDARLEREKAIFIAVALAVAVWFTWSYVVKGNLKAVWSAHKMLSAAEREYDVAFQAHKNAETFKKKKDDLTAELKQKLVEEEEFDQMIRAQGQLEEVLEGLRTEAGKSSLKLVTLDVKHGGAASAPTKAEGKAGEKGGTKKEGVSYKRSNILLVCRGQYRETVEYLLKVTDMHRVMSLNSLSMGKAAVHVARGARAKVAGESNPETADSGNSPVETKLELEHFFK